MAQGSRQIQSQRAAADTNAFSAADSVVKLLSPPELEDRARRIIGKSSFEEGREEADKPMIRMKATVTIWKQKVMPMNDSSRTI